MRWRRNLIAEYIYCLETPTMNESTELILIKIYSFIDNDTQINKNNFEQIFVYYSKYFTVSVQKKYCQRFSTVTTSLPALSAYSPCTYLRLEQSAIAYWPPLSPAHFPIVPHCRTG